MPNIEGLEYLISHLNALGWCSSNGMGVTPLSYTEIDAYNRSTESFLNGEEVLLLRKMSSNYVRFLNDKNPNTQAPYKNSSDD